ncbi:MAG: hypothetical protein NTV92_01570 [Candidatus Bipolaricaulota bacterium]|nr:hypothetical protein [Candidatus Bipolaricaulota bacterium]
MNPVEIAQAVVTIVGFPTLVGLFLRLQGRHLRVKDDLLRLMEERKDLEIAALQHTCERLRDQMSDLRERVGPDAIDSYTKMLEFYKQALQNSAAITELEKQEYEAELAAVKSKLAATELSIAYWGGDDYRTDIERERSPQRVSRGPSPQGD